MKRQLTKYCLLMALFLLKLGIFNLNAQLKSSQSSADLKNTTSSNVKIINSEKIPDSSVEILKRILLQAEVTSVTITSTNRTVEEQIEIMYKALNQPGGVKQQYDMYSSEGDAVVKKYEEGKKQNKSVSEIKKMMLDELNIQLPHAIANNKLMHIGREKEFIVFDIDLKSIQPINKTSQLEIVAKQYEGKELYRFLGRGESEKTALHFEIKKSESDAKRNSDMPNYLASAPNSIYIFLVTTVAIKPKPGQFSNLQSGKTLYLISAPILHNGNYSDPMAEEKESFLTQLKKEFVNKPEIIDQLSQNNSNSKFEVHYGKPYSPVLLKTEKEGSDAIDAYITSTKELLEGIANYEFKLF